MRTYAVEYESLHPAHVLRVPFTDSMATSGKVSGNAAPSASAPACSAMEGVNETVETT